MTGWFRRLFHRHSWTSRQYTEDRAHLVRDCRCGAVDAHPAYQPWEGM